MSYDVVIRNGTVVDGTGLAPYRADVGVRGGIITAIGRISERGEQADVDAEGHVVTPGFIDGHTHMDAQVFWDRLGTNSCWHGVTTVVMGHCGFTLAPASADDRHLVVRNLERAEDISGAAMAAGIDWTWTTFAEYLDAVDRLPKGINYAANVGHSALRTFAMGERAFAEQAAPEDLEAMEAELRSALRAGAYGFTTSRTHHHETSDNRPVASRLASWEEVRHLVGRHGRPGRRHLPAGRGPARGAGAGRTGRAVDRPGRRRRACPSPSVRRDPVAGRSSSSMRPRRRGAGCSGSATAGASAPCRRFAPNCPSTRCPNGGRCAPSRRRTCRRALARPGGRQAPGLVGPQRSLRASHRRRGPHAGLRADAASWTARYRPTRPSPKPRAPGASTRSN